MANAFDLVLNTASAELDINLYLSLLAVDETLVNVGIPTRPLEVSVFHLVRGCGRWRARSSGVSRRPRRCSTSAPSPESAPDIELVSADQINGAYERVLASDVRHRVVIVIDLAS